MVSSTKLQQGGAWWGIQLDVLGRVGRCGREEGCGRRTVPEALSCSRELDILDDCELDCDDEENKVGRSRNGVDDVRRGGQFLGIRHYRCSTLSRRAAQSAPASAPSPEKQAPSAAGTGGTIPLKSLTTPVGGCSNVGHFADSPDTGISEELSDLHFYCVLISNGS